MDQPRHPVTGRYARNDERTHVEAIAALTRPRKPLPPGIERLITGKDPLALPPEIQVAPQKLQAIPGLRR